MANETDQERADTDTGSAPDSAPRDTPRPAPYVRQRPAHRTVEPIDDIAEDDDAGSTPYTHDSSYTIRGSALSGRAYRRSRAQEQQLRRNLHYGQYLEIPKGRRDIFVSRERKTRVRTFIALVVVLLILAVAGYLVWDVLQTTWGAAS